MKQLKENSFFGEHDRYRLIRLLGQGGFSEVWLAEDTQAGINAAIKVYAPGKGLDEDGVKQFSSEFALVFNLNHPNLLRPVHYDVFERMPYLIMPYCEKGSSIKLAGKIDENTAWKFLHDVASGLAYLHAQKTPVIHQDIKPDNVLMDSNGNFLITDFGISSKTRSTLRQNFKSGESDSSGAGTMAYMSPERFSKDNLPIMAGDVWSLGVSLYELMTGHPPFGDHGGLLLKGGAEIPNLSGEWTAALKKTINRCMQNEPWHRPKAKDIAKIAKRHIKKEGDPDEPVPEQEQELKSEPEPKQKTAFLNLFAALMAGLALGFCAGYFTGNAGDQPQESDMVIKEITGITQACIDLIERGDSLLDENELKTWRESLFKYQQAKALTDQHSLPLPNLEARIRKLQEKMNIELEQSVMNAKRNLRDGSRMAIYDVRDILTIDPEHREGKTLLEECKKKWPSEFR